MRGAWRGLATSVSATDHHATATVEQYSGLFHSRTTPFSLLSVWAQQHTQQHTHTNTSEVAAVGAVVAVVTTSRGVVTGGFIRSASATLTW